MKVAGKQTAEKNARGKKAGNSIFDVSEAKLSTRVSNRPMEFTNLDKIYWPGQKITKRDLLRYYEGVSDIMLPHLKGRPQSLNRFPNGIEGINFFQKDVRGKVAEWITRFEYVGDSDGQKREYFVCTDKASLLYMANLGCIEINPWHSRIESPGQPDWCVIDLDPDNNSFNQVVETAQKVKSVLDSIRVACYCKTSGATGMHIYIPLGARYGYDQSKMFAELIVNLVHRELPALTSLERSPAKRKGKIYLDFLQNNPTQTLAAPYSVRPKPGATVSTPLHWEEVKKGLDKDKFNIHTMLERLHEVGDIFKPVLGKGINLDDALKRIKTVAE